jgi:diaminohydroxyphosphoribosylaminopyrimidine deaminase/5-amino-6-(5-phosphoribosylamino)uracil reductase
MNDLVFMQRALVLAAKGAGHVSPNPMVGCVIVKKVRVIAEGYHQKFGGAHAEVNALKKAGKAAKGATLYVTLEPCNHFGKTPPCVDAVIASGVARVVIALKDPNPLTAGKSIRKLKKAGIKVDVGMCAAEAAHLNRFFLKWISKKLPYVIAKVAQSLNGLISPQVGTQGWLTGIESQKYVHGLRSQVDAILIGRKTLQIDDPQLNVRLAKNSGAQPKRIILDSQLRTSPSAKIFKSEGGEVLLFCALPHEHARVQEFNRRGVRVFCAPAAERVDLEWLLSQLGAFGVTSVLVEGGSEVFSEFLRRDLADEWQFLIAPKWIGSSGTQGVPSFDAPALAGNSADFTDAPIQVKTLGSDILTVIGPKSPYKF